MTRSTGTKPPLAGLRPRVVTVPCHRARCSSLVFYPWTMKKKTYLLDCRENLINTLTVFMRPCMSRAPAGHGPRRNLSCRTARGSLCPRGASGEGQAARWLPPLLSFLSPASLLSPAQTRAQGTESGPARGCQAAPSSLPPLSSPLTELPTAQTGAPGTSGGA